jgi:hypothetical protein
MTKSAGSELWERDLLATAARLSWKIPLDVKYYVTTIPAASSI